MKYFKLLMLVAAVVTLGSCDETADESTPWNTASGVTVSMENATLKTKEGVGIIQVPIDVKGDKNGKVSVVVEVKEVGDNPAVEDKHYYVTDKSLTISDETGNVEIRIADDKEMNETRTFEVSLVSATHASLGDNTTTLVQITDNDTELYDRIQGEYIMTAESPNEDGTSTTETWTVTLTGASDDDSSDYNKRLYIKGMLGYSQIETTAQLEFSYDKDNNTGYVAFNNLGNYFFAVDVPLAESGDLAKAKVKLMSYDGTNVGTTPLMGYWSDDLNTITFDPGYLLGDVFDSTGSAHQGYWFQYGNFTMTRVEK